MCAFLANTISMAATLYTWSLRRICRTRVRNPITELSHQICVHYCQESLIQCHVQKNAPNSRKHPKEIVTWRATPIHWCEALSIAMHLMRAAIHFTLGSSPGSVIFDRDMFLNIPLIADWHTITQRREENQKHPWYDYAPQQRVLSKKKWKPCKLGKKDQWTIQSPTDTCKWYFDNRVLELQ